MENKHMENETMKQNPATIKFIYAITLEYLYVFYYIVYNIPIISVYYSKYISLGTFTYMFVRK